MSVKEFKEFIVSGIVKKQSINKSRAESLVNEAEEKRAFLEIAMKSIPEEKMNPNFVIDSCYDIIMELVRARLFLAGFNSGSHEAEVSYMRELGFPEADVRFADELRYNRNGIKYYGTSHDIEYAKKVLGFMKRLHPLLVADGPR